MGVRKFRRTFRPPPGWNRESLRLPDAAPENVAAAYSRDRPWQPPDSRGSTSGSSLARGNRSIEESGGSFFGIPFFAGAVAVSSPRGSGAPILIHSLKSAICLSLSLPLGG